MQIWSKYTSNMVVADEALTIPDEVLLEEEMNDSDDKDDTLDEIAWAQLDAGETNTALQTATGINGPEVKEVFLGAVAARQILAGDRSAANRALALFAAGEIKAWGYLACANSLAANLSQRGK